MKINKIIIILKIAKNDMSSTFCLKKIVGAS